MAPEFRTELAAQAMAPGVNTTNFLNGLVENLRRNQRPDVRFATAESIGIPAGLSGDNSGRQAANFAARYSAHFNSPDIRNNTAAERRVEALRRLAADIGLPPGAVPSGAPNPPNTPPGGGGANPSGGPNPPNTPPGGGSGGGAPGGKVQKVFVTNPVQIQNPQNEALANQLAASAERIMGKFTLEELNNHANNAQNMGELLSGEIGDAIRGEFSSFMSAGGDDLVRHAISAYTSGGGLDAIRQKVATGEVIQQTNQSLAGQAAGFSDEQLEKLGEKISSGNAEALKEISGILAPHIEQLSKAAGVMADPNLQTKYAQRIIDGFRQVMTTGPKSMRSYLQTNFSEFANAFAAENNIDHITPESIAKAIANNNPPPPPPPRGGGAVAPPPPSPTETITPPNPEPPTQT